MHFPQKQKEHRSMRCNAFSSFCGGGGIEEGKPYPPSYVAKNQIVYYFPVRVQIPTIYDLHTLISQRPPRYPQ